MSMMDVNDSSEDEEEDVEPTNDDEKLLWAAEKGNLELVKEILKRQPDAIKYRDVDGYTALHRASYEGKVEVAHFLIDSGASVHAKTNNGWTPLHSACRWNEPKVCAMLLRNGADINSQSNGLQTPLHIAASCKGARDLLVLLLSNKDVKPNLKNSVGDTAYDIALRTDKFSKLFKMAEPFVTEYC